MTIEKSEVLNQTMKQSINDEIDLRELAFILWHQKVFILSMVLFFSVFGFGYAITAQNIWSSHAIISEPSRYQVAELQLAADRINLIVHQGANFNSNSNSNSNTNSNNNSRNQSGFPQFENNEVFNDFISLFNNPNTKRAFLNKIYFSHVDGKSKGVDYSTREPGLIDKMAADIPAGTVDESTKYVTLSYSAEKPELASKRLVQYIDFVRQQILEKKNSELQLLWKEQISLLTERFDYMNAEALRILQNEVLRVEYSLRISKVARVDSPLERMDGQEIFNIQLGTRGLAEKLSILNEMKSPELLSPELGKIHLQLNRLKALNLQGTNFTPFNMIISPEEPLTRDKPNRPLVIGLATLLGGVLGITIVLIRYAFRRSEEA